MNLGCYEIPDCYVCAGTRVRRTSVEGHWQSHGSLAVIGAGALALGWAVLARLKVAEELEEVATAAPALMENLGAWRPAVVGQDARLEECFGWEAAAQGAAEPAARHLARMGSVPVGTLLLRAEPEEENLLLSLKLENPDLQDQRLVLTVRNHHHHRRKPWWFVTNRSVYSVQNAILKSAQSVEWEFVLSRSVYSV